MRRRARLALGGGLLAGVCIVAVAVLNFPTPAATPGASKPVELPTDLQSAVFFACLPGLDPASQDAESGVDGIQATQGLGFSSGESLLGLSVRIESAGVWSVSVDSTGATLHSERHGDNLDQMTRIAAEVIPTATSLYNCMEPYRFAAHTSEPPSSSAQLLQLYRYDATVLWPCLTAHGIDMGDPPTRDQFVSSVSARTADPFSAMKLTKQTLPRLTAALQACPLRPAYLG
ncbi:MAG TPA: hypothetical protein VGM38_04345 [Pseudolysinimonas sp.]|jgi:hypothetical protein